MIVPPSNAAEGPGDVKARAPLRATALARLGLDIARTRPTLDKAFEGANRDFERFPAYLRRRPGMALLPSTRDTVSTGMARKLLISLTGSWVAASLSATPGTRQHRALGASLFEARVGSTFLASNPPTLLRSSDWR